jgi:hypothetical protein
MNAFGSWLRRRRAERAARHAVWLLEWNRREARMDDAITKAFRAFAAALEDEGVASLQSAGEGRGWGLIPVREQAAAVWLEIPNRIEPEVHNLVFLRVGPKNVIVGSPTFDCFLREWIDVDDAWQLVLELVRAVVDGRYCEKCPGPGQPVTPVFEQAWWPRGKCWDEPALPHCVSQGTVRYAPYWS